MWLVQGVGPICLSLLLIPIEIEMRHIAPGNLRLFFLYSTSCHVYDVPYPSVLWESWKNFVLDCAASQKVLVNFPILGDTSMVLWCFKVVTHRVEFNWNINLDALASRNKFSVVLNGVLLLIYCKHIVIHFIIFLILISKIEQKIWDFHECLWSLVTESISSISSLLFKKENWCPRSGVEVEQTALMLFSYGPLPITVHRSNEISIIVFSIKVPLSLLQNFVCIFIHVML